MSKEHQSYAERRAAGQRKAIHALRRKLGLDRDVYESILQREAGVRSSVDLDDAGRAKVLDELRVLAGEKTRDSNQHAYPGKPHNFYSARAMPETITKIEAQLADMRLPWSYADSIAHRMFGIARVAWVRSTEQLAAIVAALHVEQEKRDTLAFIERATVQLQMPPAELERLTAKLPKNWRRNRLCLKGVAEHLQARLETRAEPRGDD